MRPIKHDCTRTRRFFKTNQKCLNRRFILTRNELLGRFPVAFGIVDRAYYAVFPKQIAIQRCLTNGCPLPTVPYSRRALHTTENLKRNLNLVQRNKFPRNRLYKTWEKTGPFGGKWNLKLKHNPKLSWTDRWNFTRWNFTHRTREKNATLKFENGGN